MNDQLSASLASAGGDILNSLVNVAYNERIMQKNLEYWHLQNSYNAPAQQVARLKAAGLNPNLFYGSGAGVLQSGDISAAQPVKIDSGKAISQAISDYMLVKQGNANVRLTEANANLAQNKYRTESLTQDSILLDNTFKRLQNIAKQVENSYLQSYKEEGLKGLKLDNAMKGVKKQLSDYDLKFKQLTFENEVDNFMTQVMMNKQQLENLRASFNNIQSQTALNYSGASLNSQEVGWRGYLHGFGIGNDGKGPLGLPLGTFAGAASDLVRGGKWLFNTIGKGPSWIKNKVKRVKFNTNSKWKRGYGRVTSH